MLCKLRVIIPLLVVLSLLAFLPACTTSNTQTNLTEPDYAGAITENMLLGINNTDFAQFSRDFDDAMKKAVPESNFQTQFIDSIKGKIGDYEPNSRRFFQASSQDQYTVVVYFVTYTNEPGGALVQVTFQQINGQPVVAGIIFNTPKLRG